jgi:GAF domain-containing protein
MADQIAIALSNTLQFQQAQVALQRTQHLYEASTAIANAADAGGVLQTLMTQAVTDASTAQILTYGPSDETGQYAYFEVAAHWTKDAAETKWPIGMRVPPEQVLPLLPAPGEPHIIRDATDATVLPEQQHVMQALSMRALLSHALVAGSQPVGLLLIAYRDPHLFTSAETQPLQALAGQIAVTLRNQQLVREQVLARQQLDEINQRLTGQIWQQYAHERGEAIRKIDIGPGMPPTSPPAASELAAPVLIHGQEVGRLYLEDATSDREWTPNEKALIQAVAGEVAIAIENARLIEQTERRAQREARLNRIAQQLRQSTDIHTILQTAAEQLSLALDTSHAQAQLSRPVVGEKVQQ